MPQNNPCVTNGLLPPDIYDTDLNAQLTYNIDFDFVAEEDVVVFREQPEDTFTLLTNSAATGATPPNYTINQGVSPAQVTFAAGEAPGGVSLIIGRRTDICDPVVEYQVGAAIRAGDLNASNIQLLHLIQELRSTLGFMINGNDDDPIIPGQGMDLGDLDDVTLADPIPNPSLLRWNGTDWVNNDVLESGDAWVSDNSTFATTQAGDDRWLGGGAVPDVVGGPGVTITPNSPSAGQILVSADLAGTSGLEFEGAGNAGELRIDANDGCEIVADGLNTETTAASIVQTGDPATNLDPAIRIATTLGDTTTNTDLQIVGGNNVTVTRNDDDTLTIAAAGGGGGGGDGVEVVADVAALNALVDLDADPVVEPDDGTVILIQNSTNLAANAADGDNNQDVDGLPMNVADGGPIGGYSNQIQVTVQWDAANDEWEFVRWLPVNLDNRYFNLNDGGTLQNCQSAGQQWSNGARNLVSLTFPGDPGPADFFISTEGDSNTGTADFGIGNLTDVTSNAARGVYMTAGDNDDQFGRIDILGNETGTLDVVFRVQTGNGTDAKTNQISFFADGSADFEADVEVGSLRLQQIDDNFCTLTENGASTEAWTFVFPPAAPDEGTNWALVERNVPAGEQLTATMEWTQVATAAQLDDRVAVAGDTMTGNLQMDGASVIADNGETIPNNSGNWDIQNSNVWQVPDGRTIVFPDDSDAPIPGQTGIFVCAGLVAGWTNASGGTWEHPAGGANTGNAAGVIIPFYVQTTTNIILGTQTVGS